MRKLRFKIDDKKKCLLQINNVKKFQTIMAFQMSIKSSLSTSPRPTNPMLKAAKDPDLEAS